ncbi:arginase [Aquirufa sp.]|uniref:arginase n=1 Tax=Aquirufa sp. TaxID=2676249 RepID=UPI0037C02848
MEIKLIKNRSDIGAGTRGSDMGIDALEIAAINADDDFFHRHVHEDVQTHNETIYQKNTNCFAKRIEHVVQQCERVCSVVSKNLQQTYFPIVLSGDHSSALGVISGIKKAFPDKKLGVVWIDAHADLHSPFTSPSGNIHGMPLAAAMQLDNLPCAVNEVSNDTVDSWNQLKNIGIAQPKLSSEHLVYFGLRDFEAAEEHLINQFGILHYRVEQIRAAGLTHCVQEAIDRLQDADIIFVSFDVDSLDCDQISYGTGTPVKSGFKPDEVLNILELVFATGKVVCLEVAEINPLLDNKGNKMAETAFGILRQLEKKIVQ